MGVSNHFQNYEGAPFHSKSYAKSVSVVVLAAGMSTRMGKPNKLLLSVNGKPLIRRTLETLLLHPFKEIVVVLGHQAVEVQDAIEGLQVKKVINHDYEQGQMTSVHKGLSSLTEPTEGVMIFLSDLALINQQDLHELRLGFDGCETGVLVPTFEGKRGNPIILDYTQQESVVADDKNLGCKKLITKHPELVTPLEMTNDHVVVDMDTVEAYGSVLERIKDDSALKDQALKKQEAV